MVGDRIVEVNGVNVSLENHKQVVARIQAGQDKTSLLVVDKACDDYHILHEIVVRSSLGHVVKLSDKGEYEDVEKVAMDINMNLVDNNNKTDKENGFQDNIRYRNMNSKINDKAVNECEESEAISDDDKVGEGCEETTCEKSVKSQRKLSADSECEQNTSNESTEMPKINTVSPVDKNSIKLDLSMTAKEMRDMIVSRKKKDPRKEKRRDMRRRVEMA